VAQRFFTLKLWILGQTTPWILIP